MKPQVCLDCEIFDITYCYLFVTNLRMFVWLVCLATSGFQLDTDEGGSFLPGFVEALIGIQNGETRSFDLVFPETWEQESLRGLKARFTVNTKSLSTPSSLRRSSQMIWLLLQCFGYPLSLSWFLSSLNGHLHLCWSKAIMQVRLGGACIETLFLIVRIDTLSLHSVLLP